MPNKVRLILETWRYIVAVTPVYCHTVNTRMSHCQHYHTRNKIGFKRSGSTYSHSWTNPPELINMLQLHTTSQNRRFYRGKNWSSRYMKLNQHTYIYLHWKSLMPKQFHNWLINQIGTIDILGYMHCEAHGQQTVFFLWSNTWLYPNIQVLNKCCSFYVIHNCLKSKKTATGSSQLIVA